jgi:hypothetical protein
MALAKDKAKLAVAAVKSEDTQVSYIQFLYSDLGCFVRGTALHMRCSELGCKWDAEGRQNAHVEQPRSAHPPCQITCLFGHDSDVNRSSTCAVLPGHAQQHMDSCHCWAVTLTWASVLLLLRSGLVRGSHEGHST